MSGYPDVLRCPFCGCAPEKIWGEADGVIGGGFIVSHYKAKCPAKGMHSLERWNERREPTND